MLPTGDPLGAVVTMLATPFGRLDGLAINTAGVGVGSDLVADSTSEGVIDPGQPEVGDQISLGERPKVARVPTVLEQGTIRSPRLIIKKIDGLKWNLRPCFLRRRRIRTRTRGDDGIPGTVSAGGLGLGRAGMFARPQTQKAIPPTGEPRWGCGDATAPMVHPDPFVSPRESQDRAGNSRSRPALCDGSPHPSRSTQCTRFRQDPKGMK